ncbi:Hachiman antiphage defense system protein HamA [Bradyrhizobium japonicum]
MASVAPFLIEPEHEDAGRERDLILLSDKADLSDPALTEALKRYFDKMSPMSKRVKYCAVALVGFDAAFYPGDRAQAIADEMKEAARIQLKKWSSTIGTRLKKKNWSRLKSSYFAFRCRPPKTSGPRS